MLRQYLNILDFDIDDPVQLIISGIDFGRQNEKHRTPIIWFYQKAFEARLVVALAKPIVGGIDRA